MTAHDAQALFDQGNALLARGDVRPAIEALEAAYELLPTAITAQGATVAALAAQDWAQATHYGRIACKLAPEWAENWHRLGAAYWGAGRWDEARKAFERCVRLEPLHIGAHQQLCALAGMRGEEQAEYDHAYAAIGPKRTNATAIERFHQSTLEIWMGDYLRGWRNYETRHELPLVLNGWRKPEGLDPAKRWDGKTPVETLLLFFEQGHGDAIQMARYLDVHTETHLLDHLVVLVHASLVDLFKKQARGDWDVYPLAPGEPAPAHDAYVGAMSLPYLFGTTLETVPAPADFGLRWNAPMQPGFFYPDDMRPYATKHRIALCTKGGAVASLDLDRSCHDDSFDRLRQLEGYEFVDFTGKTGSFLETAHTLLGCEILITVDSALAHLAGSLGVPTWIVPPTTFEWRWTRGVEPSPWYPTTHRFFRRRKSNDWAFAVDQIITALEER